MSCGLVRRLILASVLWGLATLWRMVSLSARVSQLAPASKLDVTSSFNVQTHCLSLSQQRIVMVLPVAWLPLATVHAYGYTSQSRRVCLSFLTSDVPCPFPLLPSFFFLSLSGGASEGVARHDPPPRIQPDTQRYARLLQRQRRVYLP